MTEYKLSKNSEYLNEIKRLYLEAFPRIERMPFSHLLKNCDLPGWDFTYYTEDGNLLGFTLVIFNETHAYLYYFAIHSQVRGQGFGTRIFNAFKEKYRGKIIFGSVEPQDEKAPNALQRQKRHAFYIRNGVRDMKLLIREFGVTYAIMGIGDEITPEAYYAIMNQFTAPGGFLLRLLFHYKAWLPEA